LISMISVTIYNVAPTAEQLFPKSPITFD